MRPDSITKEQFIEHASRMADRRGEEFDQNAAEAKFDELDKNDDGVLSLDELSRGRQNRPPHSGEGNGSDDESG